VTEIAERHAARALVLDDDERVLLFRFHDPGKDADHLASPGGGVEAGETYERAAARELEEELGLRDVDLGPPIWDRVSEFDLLGTWTRAFERFYLVRLDAEDLEPYDGHLAGENVVAREWWTLEEIEATDEAVWPSELASLVRTLLREGVPPAPIPIGA
jgi:8-oxo-dGTP pyrophosphatase MutT (NUDIX family)